MRLSHYVQTTLPRPEAFPAFAAPAIADTMPKGWVHAVLKSGRALVLIDGVDEVSALQQEEIQTWLNDLIATFSQACFIVTSRPHAIQRGWMIHEDFTNTELQPMKLSDI